jgi:predicted nucleic acid-binding protein
VIVADTSGLLALFNAREPRHEEVRKLVERDPEPMVVSPYVVAEVDYLVATRLGVEAEHTVLQELASGAYHLAAMDEADLRSAAAVVEQYHDQAIGVADASVVVLASRHRTKSILTLDHRHFSVLRPREGGRFRLLP